MKLLIASNNIHKIDEIKAILSDLNYEIVSLKDLNLNIEVEETADTCEGNAIIKASAVFNITGIPSIADDTGLMVEHLNGAPGVYSARYAGPGCSYADNNNKLLNELSNYPKPWKAKFISVICLKTNSEEKTFTGICEGTISPVAKGENGFGYDPVFIPEGMNISYAQLSSDEKNKISHRARSLNLLREYLIKNPL